MRCPSCRSRVGPKRDRADGVGPQIADVDDSDTYECRPHAPGEIRAALLGRRLTVAHRRGKTMCARHRASGVAFGGSDARHPLGMSGKIVIADGHGSSGWRRLLGTGPGTRRLPLRPFLVDVRRRRFTTADRSAATRPSSVEPGDRGLGPDAREITPAAFRAVMARGTAPVKARLLDQDMIAGVGNLLADQALWLAKINPSRAVNELRVSMSTGCCAGCSAPSRRGRGAACTRCRSSRSAA